jgi:DGQHR domain-containing protein
MKKTVQVIRFEQPIGQFYITKIQARDLVEIVEVKPRLFDSHLNDSAGGPQRPQSNSRIEEISEFCADPDATFPTPIIISVYEGECSDIEYSYDSQNIIGHVLDGQHRIAGIKKFLERCGTTTVNFEIPVVLMFGLTSNDEAYVFSIINSKQQKVTLSHVYDLYSNFDKRHPIVSASKIAKALNREEKSPFYRKIKMLGKKSNTNGSNKDGCGLCDIDDEYIIEETITQAAVVSGILNLIESPNNRERLAREAETDLQLNDVQFEPKRPFRKYFLEGDKGEGAMYKILANCFNALKSVFPIEWGDHNTYILSKAIGYDAIMMALPQIILLGRSQKTLSQEFFFEYFSSCKARLLGVNLTSQNFNSTNQGKKKLSTYFLPQTESLD